MNPTNAIEPLHFDGLTAVVTGAGRGLGRSYAIALAQRGANVVVNDLGDPNLGDARAVAEEISAAGGRATEVLCSVADRDGPRQIVEAAVAAFGGVDIVINNAGIQRFRHLSEVMYAELVEEWEVHLLGQILLVREAWPYLRASATPAVVNTSSGIGLFGYPDAVGYGSAKMGVVGFTKNAAADGAADGIRVNSIAPMAKTLLAGDDWGEIGEVLDPDLVAPVVLWLAHPSCRFTGEVLSAGGGRVARVAIEVAKGAFVEDLTLEDVARLAPEFMTEPTLACPSALAEGDIVGELRDKARMVGH